MFVCLTKFMVWGMVFQISRKFKNVGLNKGIQNQTLAELKVSRTIILAVFWELCQFWALRGSPFKVSSFCCEWHT
jgi:hypothetical protein